MQMEARINLWLKTLKCYRGTLLWMTAMRIMWLKLGVEFPNIASGKMATKIGHSYLRH